MTYSHFSRRRNLRHRSLISSLMMSLVLLALTSTIHADDGPKGVIYIESNTPDNFILGFKLNARGKLVPLPGSPYHMSGSGVHPTSDLSPANLGPFDSDQNMVSDGKRIYAVNSGSDTIAVFNIRRNGSLVPVNGSPFQSGGINPVSVGLSGNTLVVVNKDYDLGRPGYSSATRRPNYTTFRITSQGQLIPIPNSTIVADDSGIAGPGHAVPTQALIGLGGKVAFDATFLGLTIRSFQLKSGRLIPVDIQKLPQSESPTPGNPFQLAIPLGLATHPKTAVLYVGLVLDQKIAVYNYDRQSANFSFVRTVTGTGNALFGACWIVLNREGTRMYVANNFNNSISVLNTEDPRNPIILQTLPLVQDLGKGSPFQIALDGAGRYLYVVTQAGADGQPNGNALQALRVERNGRVTLIDAVPLPTAPSRPQGVIAR